MLLEERQPLPLCERFSFVESRNIHHLLRTNEKRYRNKLVTSLRGEIFKYDGRNLDWLSSCLRNGGFDFMEVVSISVAFVGVQIVSVRAEDDSLKRSTI